jgi:arylsulfatase A-like enzyme
MIRWPGKIRPRVSNEMFSEMDFFPTLAKFAGVKIPTDRASMESNNPHICSANRIRAAARAC